MKSDIYKIRRSLFYWLHLIFPLCGMGLMVLFALFSKANYIVKFAAFFQLFAIAYPFVIGVVCENIVDQEARAGHCQNMLMLADRKKAIISKFLILISCGFLSLFTSALLYELLLNHILPNTQLSIVLFLKPVIILWGSNLMIYALHLIIAFQFGKNACIGVGVVGSLLTALMQTDLGTGLWFLLPHGIGIRLTEASLNSFFINDFVLEKEVKLGYISAIMMTVFCVVGMIIWFSFYGGQNTTD
ncbi:MAG: lantibiotic immunity ABC transporter MutG family permease subunit [Lachnospiraceae bacterium]|nr:lantibiotic immunity ABC transporter MutG family permease subunit [Lachnospiraceae bacterium]